MTPLLQSSARPDGRRSHPRPARRSHRGAACAAVLALAVVASVPGPQAVAQNTGGDAALQQTVNAHEHIADQGERRVVRQGHLDFGPMLLDGEFDYLIRDDAVTPPVWRHTNDTLIVLGQAAQQNLPDDDSYSFVGAEPGQTVWAVPQNQIAGVPWLGWNTQAPSLQDAVERGVTISYEGHRGDGSLTAFLQNGGFGEPQTLFTSAESEGQEVWVDLNTHTHMNWVFTEPGVHLVRLKISAEPAGGGEPLEATHTLRFLVGPDAELDGQSDDTQAIQDAFDASWDGGDAEEHADAESHGDADDEQQAEGRNEGQGSKHSEQRESDPSAVKAKDRGATTSAAPTAAQDDASRGPHAVVVGAGIMVALAALLVAVVVVLRRRGN